MKAAHGSSSSPPGASDYDRIIQALLSKDDSPLSHHTPKWLELRSKEDIAKLCSEDDPSLIEGFASHWLTDKAVALREKIAGRGERVCGDPYFDYYSIRELLLSVMAVRRKAKQLGIPPDVFLQGYQQARWVMPQALEVQRIDWWRNRTPPSGSDHWKKWWKKLEAEGLQMPHTEFFWSPFDVCGEALLKGIQDWFLHLDELLRRLGMLVLTAAWQGNDKHLSAPASSLRELKKTGNASLPAHERYVEYPTKAPILDAFYFLSEENHKLPIRDEIESRAIELINKAWNSRIRRIDSLSREITALGLTGLPKKTPRKRTSIIKPVRRPRK